MALLSPDVGGGTIIALSQFVVPPSFPVFPGYRRCVSRDDLFTGRAFGGYARLVVARERFRKYFTDPVGPAPVVLDDLIRDLVSCRTSDVLGRPSARRSLDFALFWAARPGAGARATLPDTTARRTGKPTGAHGRLPP